MKLSEITISSVFKHLFHFYHRTDLKKWDYTPKDDKTIYGVYHIYCVNDWKELVCDQINALKDSGLLEKTKTLYVSCIILQEEDADYVVNVVGQGKCEIISKGYSGEVREFPALDFLREKAKSDDFLVYYFHTKGVSISEKNLKDYHATHYQKLKDNVNEWRKMMEYFIFYKHDVAINVLEQYNAYSTCYKEFRKCRYYAGNFWWSKSSYIKTLPPLTVEERKNRYCAEFWVCRGAKPFFDAFNHLANPYLVKVPDCIYRTNVTIPTIIKMSETVRFVYDYYKSWLYVILKK